MSVLMEYIERVGFSGQIAAPLAIIIAIISICLLAFLANMIARRIIVGTVHKVLLSTPSERDDIFVKRRVFERVSQLAPAIVIYELTPLFLSEYTLLNQGILTLSLIYMVVVGVLFLDGMINAGLEIYSTYRISREFPVTSFAQVAKIGLYFLGFITVLSLLLGQSPLTFLAGLGALTAVLMLVFKDPILGFVAGVQLSANRMVAVGDWIEMPKFAVDGDVIEIALTTVKIRNFDKTITTVPTQALISDSFKNWRGMKETGGRRIKRCLFVDISSIRFCDEEMLNRFTKIQYISEYIERKKQELDEFNQSSGADLSSLANGRRLTNVGTFRAYIEAYLHHHPKISKSLTFLVRQLQPTTHGLPIEVYVFSLDTDWIAYEKIQADIFDHILAAASEFDLHLFQNPSGHDFQNVSGQVA